MKITAFVAALALMTSAAFGQTITAGGAQDDDDDDDGGFVWFEGVGFLPVGLIVAGTFIIFAAGGGGGGSSTTTTEAPE